MDFKRLSNSKERFIGKRLSYRIFLNKDAKYYAINKNDKSPAFTYRSHLNLWIKNRIEQIRDQQTSNQAELFWQPPLVGWHDYAMREKIVGARSEGYIDAPAEPRKRLTSTRCELAKRNLADAWTVKVCEIETKSENAPPLAEERSKDAKRHARA